MEYMYSFKSLLFLLVSCLASSATAFITLTSSLQASGRSYACPGEQVTFTCVTDGTIQTWTIPPIVNESSAAAFHISDYPGQAILLMPQAIRLLIGTSPKMSSQMTVTLSDNNFALGNTTVKCRSNNDQFKELQYGLSAVPQPPLSIRCSNIDQHEHHNGSSKNVTISLEWDNNHSDNADISHYLLQVSYNNGSKIAEHRTTDNRDSVVVELESQEEKNVTVEVFTVNKCNQNSTSAVRKNIMIPPTPAVSRPTPAVPTGGLNKPKCTGPVSGGEIAGIALTSLIVGVIVGVIPLVIIYYMFFKERKKEKQIERPIDLDELSDHDKQSVSRSGTSITTATNETGSENPLIKTQTSGPIEEGKPYPPPSANL